MAILVVVMMAATAFAPAIIAIGDAVESVDGASASTNVRDVSVKFFTTDSKSSKLSDLAYLGDELPKSLDPTQWVRDDPETGGSGYWYNINSMNTSYGNILTYGDLMASSQIVSQIVSHFVDGGGDPIFTPTTYQIMQIEYTVLGNCTVNIQIAKDGVTLKDANYTESTTAAGAQLGVKKQCVLYSIEKTKGDLRPTSERGGYDVTVLCDQKTSVYSQTVQYSEEDVTLYGIIYDNNANLPGGEIDPTIVTNATITYNILDSTGEIYKKDQSTQPLTTAGSDYGKFRITLPYGYLVKITNVSAPGYSFLINGNKFTSQPVVDKITDDINDIIPPTQQRKSPIFTADQFSSVINIMDSAILGLSDIGIKAFWYYRVIESGGSIFYDENPDPTHIVSGTVNTVTDVTDSDGNITITYTEPQTSRNDVEMKLYVAGVNTDAYSFSVDTLEIGSSSKTEFPKLEHKGNIYLDLKHEIDEVLRAEESSFIVTFLGQENSSGGGSAPLNGVEVSVKWLYECPDPVKGGNWYKTSDDSDKSIPFSQVGRAETPVKTTDINGQIIIAYRLPVIGAGGESYKSYLYIYSKSNVFTMASISLDDETQRGLIIGTHEGQLKEVVSGYDGCKAILGDDIGKDDVTLYSEEVTYTVKWTIVPEEPGSMPESVDVSYISDEWDRTAKAITSVEYCIDDKIEFNIVVRENDSFKLSIVCSTYVIKPSSPYIGSIMKDFKDDTYKSVAYKAKDPVTSTDKPGYIADGTYTVNGLSKSDRITFTYMVGVDQYSVIVDAVSDGAGGYKAIHKVSGWDHQTVTSMAVRSSNNIYLGEFGDSKEITAVKLVDKKFVGYYDEVSSVPTLENIVTKKTVQVLYNGKTYTSFTLSEAGTAVVSVPESGTLVYQYEEKNLVTETTTTGAFIGYQSINFNNYVNVQVGVTSVIVTVKYVASSSLENVSSSVVNPIVTQDTVEKEIPLKDTVKFEAPVINGFQFSGWVCDGIVITQEKNGTTCSITADENTPESLTLYAVYGAVSKTTSEQSLDPIAISIGAVAIIAAFLAVILSLFKGGRY